MSGTATVNDTLALWSRVTVRPICSPGLSKRQRLAANLVEPDVAVRLGGYDPGPCRGEHVEDDT